VGDEADEYDGYGGGLFLDTRQSTSLGFQLSRILFWANVARWGRNVYILATDLKVAPPISKFNFEFEPLLSRNGSLMGGTRENAGTASVDLLEKWRERRATVHVVAVSGTDDVICGRKLTPCASLGYAAGQLDDRDLMLLQIQGTVDLRHAMRLSSVEVNGNEETSAAVTAVLQTPADVQIAEAQNAVIAVSDTAVFASLAFHLTQPLCASLLRSVGVLRLDAVSFSSDPATAATVTQTFSILSVVAGQLRMSDCSFATLVSGVPVLAFSPAIGVTASDPVLTISRATFLHISISEPSSAVLHLAG
jgi:hypothetical protein